MKTFLSVYNAKLSESFARGYALGVIEGRIEKEISVLLKMLKLGMPLETILFICENITESFIQKINTRMTVGHVYDMYINELLEQALKACKSRKSIDEVDKETNLSCAVLARLARNPKIALDGQGFEACNELAWLNDDD
jgi:hypothetical protein